MTQPSPQAQPGGDEAVQLDVRRFRIVPFDVSRTRVDQSDAVQQSLETFVVQVKNQAPRDPSCDRDQNPYGDTAFMRHAGLHADISREYKVGLQSVALLQTAQSRIERLESLWRDFDGVVERYRTALEMVRLSYRAAAARLPIDRAAWLSRAAQHAQGLGAEAQADIAYLRAYEARDARQARVAWRHANAAVEADPIFLRAHILRMEIVETALVAGRNRLSDSACRLLVARLAEIATTIVRVSSDPMQLILLSEHLFQQNPQPSAGLNFMLGVTLRTVGRMADAEQYMSRAVEASADLPRHCRRDFAAVLRKEQAVK